MKIHSTNYYDTFIEIAEDCPAKKGEVPPIREHNKTVAHIQFDLVHNNPYKFTSDDVLFQVFAHKNNLLPGAYEQARIQLFSKGQACLRASPLTKRYGWGVHYDKDGRIAIYGCETTAYKKFSRDQSLKVIKAMRSSK